MCRWLAYIGDPIFMDSIIIKPPSSLLEQSLNSKMSFRKDGSILTTNGDGFGIGWYNKKPEPGLFKTAEPAWANDNLSEICNQVRARIFMSHIRAASVGSVQRNNAHPFKYKNWLFQHNGSVSEFHKIRRELLFDLKPELFNSIKGDTDSESIFMLAVNFGLEENPKLAIERTIKYLLGIITKNNIEPYIQLSCAISDGKSIFTVRYSTEKRQNTQYFSTSIKCLQDINQDYSTIPKNSIFIVSEPLDDFCDSWKEVPPSSFVTFNNGKAKIEKLEL